ncbi:methyl-accepting chemotaxis protein [Paenibacillus albus]|uniref:Methyl-accepting chemotaxis protein n=1 Tax=Paenibacillus albus TaxID=2495582 RepID=A0A3Q8X228_9BACL|nr:methyl-accepting chemotaxis protein [Paenibacillus albus]AZN38271.1 methyl-accepting chemotaxis protein [Paenibacillus albus]
MKRNLFTLTLRNKLIIAFTVILLVPSLTIGWFSYQTAKSQIESRMNMTVTENVRVLDEMLTGYIQPITTDVDYLSQTFKLDAGQPTAAADLQTLIAAFQKVHTQVDTAYLGTSKGEMLLSPQQELPADFDPRTRPWYESAMKANGQIVITEPYINATDGKVVVTIAKSTPNGAGVVGVDLNLEALSTQIESVKIGKEGYASIADNSKTFLIHPHQQPGTKVPDEIAGPMYAEQTAFFTFDEKSSKMRESVTTNKLTGWKLAGTFSVNEIDKDASKILNQTMLVVVICLLVGTALIYIIIRAIVRPIRALIHVSEQVSNGDLTVSLDVSGAKKDEITKLSTSFNTMIVSLKTLLAEVNETSHQLAASSEQLSASSDQTSMATQFIAENIQQMASGSEKQVESVRIGSTSVGEMSRGVEEIAANAQLVTEVAVQTSHISAEGNAAIETAITQMQSIERTFEELSQVITGLTQQSAEIGQMVNMIQDISTQTNLLSLNASIEAARAGEHGRGFAVVAQEVKKLAEQTAVSSKSVIELVESMQGGTERAVHSMNATSVEVTAGIAVISRAGALFKQIQGSVLEVEAQIKEVSQVSQRISSDGHETVTAINSISGIAQESALATQNVSAAAQQQLASMEEIAASAAFLTKMAEDLQLRVERFKL